MTTSNWHLSEDRFFDPDPTQRRVARGVVRGRGGAAHHLPARPCRSAAVGRRNASFGSPVDLFIIPDHYVFRMLYSQGVPLEALGVPGRDGGAVETDHRKIWQRFAEHYHLFRGTPTGVWLDHALVEVFGIDQKLTGANAQAVYDRDRSQTGDARIPAAGLVRALQHRGAVHDRSPRPIRWPSIGRWPESGWDGHVVPTFRPDAVVNLLTPGWSDNLAALRPASGSDVTSYAAFIRALEDRRAFFKRMGATATDHAAETAYTGRLDAAEAEAIFQAALRGDAIGRRCPTLHRPHADRDGAHEHRRRPGDAAASSARSADHNAHPRALRRRQGRRHPDRPASSRATCGRCWTPTATIRG